jgi:hypothetical protein
MTIRNPLKASNLFRPCIDPRVTASTCSPGPFPGRLPDFIPEPHRTWIYGQYYGAYAIARPDEYPWTSLGYTFDWAPDESGRARFMKFGESEFVVPQGAQIEITQKPVRTEDYCAAK